MVNPHSHRRPDAPRQRLLETLDRHRSPHAPVERMLITAPSEALTYLQALLQHFSLADTTTVIADHSRLPGEFMARIQELHQQTGPFRKLFAILDLPEGKTAFESHYKGIGALVRHHDLSGAVLFRSLFSRPDFSLWLSLHTTLPGIPGDPAQYQQWLQHALQAEHPLFPSREDPTPWHNAPHLLETAVKQARQLARERSLRPDDHHLPFTEVHELMTYLSRMAQRRHSR
ncbi:MAG: hypothetical protein HQL78_01005 [Magnetococcales bacterium]|nr:hypothetical protein [Magnetococcales bacterium]